MKKLIRKNNAKFGEKSSFENGQNVGRTKSRKKNSFSGSKMANFNIIEFKKIRILTGG